MTSSAIAPSVNRCGVCDAVTVTAVTCAVCHEPVCLKHARIRGPVGQRETICAICEHDGAAVEA